MLKLPSGYVLRLIDFIGRQKDSDLHGSVVCLYKSPSLIENIAQVALTHIPTFCSYTGLLFAKVAA